VSDVRTLGLVEDEKLVIHRVQDVEPILERAKTLHNAGAGWSQDKDYVHAASLPNVLIEAYCNQHGITFADWMEDEEHQRRMLNDPSLEHFRIWKGRV
jgi:hypothetical protein